MDTPHSENQTILQSTDTTLGSYFTRMEWVVYASLIVIGLILRWTLLDMRPYHHDESLHGMYGRYFYDFPDVNYYKYDPMLHGPMLYNSMRFIYAMFGDSLWAARTPVCIMGSLFMLAPLLFRRFFAKSSVLILTAAVALSPTLIYWSRFLREDYWVVSGMLLVVYGFTLAPDRLKALCVMLGIAIQWCTKENAYVTAAMFLCYLAFEAGFLYFFLKEGNSLASRIVKYISSHPWISCWSFVFAFFVFCWFYSAGFRYPEGIIDGLGKKGYDYWMEHHKKERIEGPFNFPLYMLGWYELPFLIAYLTHIALFYRRARSEIQFLGGFILCALVLSCFAAYGANFKEVEALKFFKLKDTYDVVGLFLVLFHAPIVTIHHLLRREYGMAASAYFFTATLFAYCYVGEKVPWLSMYPLIFGLPYLALFYQDYFSRFPVQYRRFPLRTALLWTGMICMLFGLFFMAEEWSKLTWPITSGSPVAENSLLLAIGALITLCSLSDRLDSFLGYFNLGRTAVIITGLFMLRASIQTNFLYAGKETEYISQVHTTYELAEAAKQIIDDVLFERHMYRPKVLVNGEATWPLSWYFRHLKDEYRFSANENEKSTFTYIFQDWDEAKGTSAPEGYTARRVNLRGWWVPDFREMNLKKFLNYSINHYPWGPSGFTYTTLLVANDVERFKK